MDLKWLLEPPIILGDPIDEKNTSFMESRDSYKARPKTSYK